jgi:uncharacterized protein (DUF488 family)
MIKLYTIGYEGCEINQFLDVLSSVGIELVADIRALPLSRKFGFSKNSFKELLATRDIKYRHFRELGDPKTGREAAKQGDYRAFRKIYLTQFETKAAKSELRDLVAEANLLSTCLLCFEKSPRECHRLIVANSMRSFGFTTINLFGDGASIENGDLTKRTRRDVSKSFAATQQNLR